MIYIPMLKNRKKVEMAAAFQIKECFSEKIIPLFEIIAEEYNIRYETDSEGNYIKELHNTRWMKKKSDPVEEDIITLPYLNELIDHKKMFVEYFRYSIKKYSKKVKIKSARVAYDISNDYTLYKKKVLSVTQYSNMIPVISVKPEFDIPQSELIHFIAELKQKTDSIALRITEEWISPYKDIICKHLTEKDYLLFDVEEQSPSLKFMEIEELMGYHAKCQMVLLNSPRKVKIHNGEYPEHDKTDIIDNCAREVAGENHMTGYGDYCGLKDVMPINDGSSGKGAALALLYEYKENIFYSYCNHDTNKGQKGYMDILPLIIKDEKTLNPGNDCPGYKRIHLGNGLKGWNTWHKINVVRYIFQTYQNL